MTQTTMKALQLDPKNLQLSLVEIPIPKPKDNEILIKVAYSGICGTDLHIIEGHFPFSSKPNTLGHEFDGVAVEVGKNVNHISKGDRIAIDPNRGCNVCYDCTSGNYHYCKAGGINNTVGIFKNGGWAEYAVVPENQVYILPENISLEQGALMEPISCISHGVDRLLPLPLGTKILIQGAGIIGNLWACILHIQGHRKVTMVEPKEFRRELFKKIGLGYNCISPEELKSRLGKPEFNVDLVVDCSGFGPAIEGALNHLNPGGRLAIFGVTSPETQIKISPYNVYKNELEILGILINPFSCNKSLGFIEVMGSSYLKYEQLGIKVFTLSQYKEAINALKAGSISKAIFKFDEKL